MSFAQQYEAHAYHDLIAEAEKQGIGVGVERERERIIKLLDVLATQEPPFAQTLINNLKILIKGENK